MHIFVSFAFSETETSPSHDRRVNYRILFPSPPLNANIFTWGSLARHFLVLSSRDERASTLSPRCVSKGEGVDTVADLAVSIVAFGEGRFRGRRATIFQIANRLSRAIRSLDQ